MSTLTDQLLDAINASGKSCYRIAKDSGVDYVSLCKFKRGAGKTTLTLRSADALAEYFGLSLASNGTVPLPKGWGIETLADGTSAVKWIGG